VDDRGGGAALEFSWSIAGVGDEKVVACNQVGQELSSSVVRSGLPDTALRVKITGQDYALQDMKTKIPVKVIEKRSEIPDLAFRRIEATMCDSVAKAALRKTALGARIVVHNVLVSSCCNSAFCV